MIKIGKKHKISLQSFYGHRLSGGRTNKYQMVSPEVEKEIKMMLDKDKKLLEELAKY